MNDYINVKIKFSPCSEAVTDITAAILAAEGFESFVPAGDSLSAYIRSELFTESTMTCLTDFPIPDVDISWESELIPGQDWNSEWEKHYFKPIVIEDRCVIHSSFHKDVPTALYDVVIDPKMAFGTGHHSTTSLILRQLLSMDLGGKSVIDMGTGTGILSILASMRGASPVTGIEIDEPAWENAVDNCKLNSHPEISMLHGDASLLGTVGYEADVFLANINRNVICADISHYHRATAMGGLLIVSGFYEEDISIIRDAAEQQGFAFDSFSSMNDWACVRFKKTR